jgi:competence protein ComEA
MLTRFLTVKELLVLLGLAAATAVGGIGLYVHHRSDSSAEPSIRFSVANPGENAALQPAEPARLELLPPLLPLDPLEAPPAGGKEITVAVTGAVMKPGAYAIDEEARAQDLIILAGGPRPEADLSDINLATKLIDGSTLTIPASGVKGMAGNTLILRGGQSAVALNPPEYTKSGWAATSVRHSAGASSGGTSQNPPTPPSDSRLTDLNRANQQELELLPGIGPKLAQQIIRHRETKPFHSVEDLVEVDGIGPKKVEALRAQVVVQ